ncbi:MAG: PilZ domain-containing protein [Polyangiaceae bacterium]|nr:PilZ domain-containing protein [Polyangiaceae bacterium]
MAIASRVENLASDQQPSGELNGRKYGRVSLGNRQILVCARQADTQVPAYLTDLGVGGGRIKFAEDVDAEIGTRLEISFYGTPLKLLAEVVRRGQGGCAGIFFAGGPYGKQRCVIKEFLWHASAASQRSAMGSQMPTALGRLTPLCDEVFRDFVQEEQLAALTRLAVAAELCAAPARDPCRLGLASVICFINPTFMGSLDIRLSRDLLRGSYPENDFTSADLQDWIGELANQTLGALKRRLLGCEIDVSSGSPFRLSAGEIAARNEINGAQEWTHIKAEHGCFAIMMKAVSARGVELLETLGPSDDDIAADGELEFF